MYENILIPYDGSEESEKAAQHGVELANELGSTVHALYVIDLPGAPRAIALREDEEEIRERYREYGEEVLAEVVDLADEHGVEAETGMRTGAVHEEVVDYAEDERMDAIVMVSAYRGRLGSILGGTTDKVVRLSSVPVISRVMQADEPSIVQN